MTTEQFRVPGVACQHCVRAITDEVSTLEGVQRVLVSIDDKTVTVEHTDQVTSDAV
ncbi:MAG: heavy-metal-associated domain-containing protein, partial [Chloroflexaceae bacterium]